jgi:transcriptional regulator with XRE-family HTH domain
MSETADNKDIDFGQRIKRLREERAWSQADLAREAGLSAAMLSRLLSSDRTPRMEHLAALASAFSITVAELISGTTAKLAMREWVPREEYEDADASRAEAQSALRVAHAELKAREAEVAQAKSAARDLISERSRLQQDLAAAQAQAGRARLLADENLQLKRQLQDALSLAARNGAVAQQEAQRAQESQAIAECNLHAWNEACSVIAALEADLRKAKGETVGVAVVSAALAGLAGAMLATPAKTSSGAVSRRRR